MSYRVLITSSRTWCDPAPIHDLLHEAQVAAHGSDHDLVVVHGDAIGGDRIAREWARAQQAAGWPVTHEPHPYRGSLGSRGGYVRNADMVKLGADRCLAFLCPCEVPGCDRPRPHDTHGTDHCARLAEKAGIPTTRLRWADR
jgi:hypothetical protein